MSSYNRNQEIVKEYQELYAPFLEDLETQYKNIFPNGKIRAEVEMGIGLPILYVTTVLINNIVDQSHRTFANDPAGFEYMSFLPSKTPSLDEKIVLEMNSGGVRLQPEEGTHYAMSIEKISFRKSTATIDKQIIKLVKHFKKIGSVVLKNNTNLYKSDIKEKYLEINL